MSLRRLEGLWSAELRAGDCSSNIGVLVFRPQKVFGDFYEEGRVRGGDRYCAYHGTYVIENFGFTADFVSVLRDPHRLEHQDADARRCPFSDELGRPQSFQMAARGHVPNSLPASS